MNSASVFNLSEGNSLFALSSSPGLREAETKIGEASSRIFNLLRSGGLSKHKKQLTREFAQIKPEELKLILGTYFEEVTKNEQGEDPIKIVEKLAEMIPFEKLEEAAFKDQISALKEAQSLLHEAKYHLENSQTNASPSLKAKLSEVVEALLSFIESFLCAFGVADFFRPSSTQLQRDIKFQKIMMLVSFYSMLSAMLIPLIGVQVAGPIIGGSFLLFGVLSVIYPKISPTPTELPCGARNWTKECRQGKMNCLSFSKGREDILNEIASTLIKSKNGQLKKHPLLQGESRVGKNQTAKAFVQALERGDYPELKGMKVFYVNAADLCKKGDFIEGKSPLVQLSEAMGRHKKNIILVIDEIQTPFLSEEHTSISQKLKSMLDADGDFPHVIAITTSRELNENIKSDVAFMNRFNPITIKSTDREVTQEILAHSVLTLGNAVLCEKEALEMIYKRTEGKPQPYTSDLLLRKCIELTSKKQRSQLVEKIQTLKNRKEFLASQGVFTPLVINSDDDMTSKIEDLAIEIKELEEQLKEEEGIFNHLFQNKEKIAQVKAETYRTIMKVAEAEAASLSRKEKVQLNTFMLMSLFLAPALNAYIRDKANELKMKVMIDESIIDEAMEEISL